MSNIDDQPIEADFSNITTPPITGATESNVVHFGDGNGDDISIIAPPMFDAGFSNAIIPHPDAPVDSPPEFEFDDASKVPNLLDQLPTYSYTKNKDFIKKMRAEYARQQQLNTILEADDDTIEKNMQKLKEFVENNADNIAKQLAEIAELSNKFEKVYARNQELKNKHEELERVQNDARYSDLAFKIKEIKKAKTEINHFLEEHGIVLSE